MYNPSLYLTYQTKSKKYSVKSTDKNSQSLSRSEKEFNHLLTNLFISTSSDDENSISKPRAFDQYFRYRRNENNISESEKTTLLEEPNRANKTQIISNFIRNKDFEEFRNMYDSFMDKLNAKSFNKSFDDQIYYYKNIFESIHAALDINNDIFQEEVASITTRLHDIVKAYDIDIYLEGLSIWDRVIGLHEGSDEAIFTELIIGKHLKGVVTEEDKQKIKSYFKSVKNFEYFSEQIAKFIHPDRNHNGSVLDKTDLYKILAHYFMEYAKKESIDGTLLKLFRNSADTITFIESSTWNNNKEVLIRFKELIETKDDELIKILLDISPDGMMISFLWYSLFNHDKEKLDEYLNSDKRDSIDKIEIIRKAWSIIKANDFFHVDFDHPDLKEIGYESIIETLYKELQYAQSIEDKINNPDLSNEEELTDFYNHLKSSPLQIKYTNELINKIDISVNVDDDTPF